MSRVSMEAHGRFGLMFADAVQNKGVSLREIAAKVEMTYEQIRKCYLGTSSPSPLLTKELCKMLGMDLKLAQEAVNSDRMERKFGTTAFSMQGRDPRLSDIEPMLPQLSKQEWDMFVGQIRGFVQQKRRSK